MDIFKYLLAKYIITSQLVVAVVIVACIRKLLFRYVHE